MARTMYDSTTANDIPLNAQMVAGYINGGYAWSAADWARFPNATKIRIAISSINDGDCLDVEKGDATASEAPGWIRERQASGLAIPTIYCNLSTWPAVQAACEGLNYASWIADWTGQPHELPGAVAVQYADPATGSGGHWDLSLVSDASWHPSSTPTFEEIVAAFV